RRLRAEIEERQQAEAALRQVQKMEAIGQLTGGIAHDFNNMLTVVLGSTEALKKALPADEKAQHRRADLVMQAATQAAALTHRLLAFARRQPSDPKPASLNVLVGGLIDMLHRTIGESIELEIDLEEELPLVTIDSNQLENALLNLAVNARDAMPGGGKLVIRTLSRGDRVLLTVSDTGIGMSEETQRRAMEPFFTTKRHGEGTGLGLAQVAGFMAQSDGSLDLVSTEGKGTTVRLSFPRLPEGTAIVRDTVPDGGQFDGKARHALVVEDQQGVREHVAESLRQLGFDVATAADAMAARSHVDAGHPVDLLMTDIGLPGGTDGWQVADYVRQVRPGVRIVLMTGYAQPNAAPLGPGTELIMKPFVRSTLELRLTRLFGRDRA
ncbi:MAG: response regulator, partial [Reyranella sp.]